MNSIYWNGFTWEAFATLATGFGALLAAIIVGLKQVGIAKEQVLIAGRQNLILERQAHLEEVKLRSELFERRFELYESTRDFCSKIMAEASEPERSVQVAFLVAIDKSRFLFRPSVHADLTEIWTRSCRFFATKAAMKHKFETTGEYGAQHVDDEYEYLQWLTDRIQNLSEIFGDEAKLGIATIAA